MYFVFSCLQVSVWAEHGVHSTKHLYLQRRLHWIQLPHRWETERELMKSHLHLDLALISQGLVVFFKADSFLSSQPFAGLTVKTGGSVWNQMCANVLQATEGPPVRKVTWSHSQTSQNCRLVCIAYILELLAEHWGVSLFVFSELWAALSAWRYLPG